MPPIPTSADSTSPCPETETLSSYINFLRIKSIIIRESSIDPIKPGEALLKKKYL